MGVKHQAGSYVRCASAGVCRIEEIRTMPVPGMDAAKEYYVLLPVGSGCSAVYIPVDNEKLTAEMLPVLTAGQAEQLIRSAVSEPLPWINDRKERTELYRQILKRCDRLELLRLMIGMYLRRRELSAAGRKLSGSDEAVLRQAERLIGCELSFALGIEELQAGDYIRSLMETC